MKGPEASVETMIFRPAEGVDKIITSPEQLAIAGISVHHDAINATWGEGAADRYMATRRSIQENGKSSQGETDTPTTRVAAAKMPQVTAAPTVVSRIRPDIMLMAGFRNR